MRQSRVRTMNVLAATTLALTACGVSTSQIDAGGTDTGVKDPGTERGPCYGNGTCNAGLTCASDLCVSLYDAATFDATVEDANVETDAGTIDASALDASPATDSDSGSVDAQPDAGPCANHIPIGGVGSDPTYGTTVGRSFREFSTELLDCSGAAHRFYDSTYCDAATSYTVVSIAAGWCHPCQMESALITEDLVHRYGPHGVRVVQLLVQDPDYHVPDATFCNQWVSTYALSVTPPAGLASGNFELLDPAEISNIYFPDGSLPSTLIVDNRGVIRFHEDGASESLASVTSELDTLLGL